MIRHTGIIKTFASIKIFLMNGQGYVADFKYPVLLAVALKVYLPNATNLTLCFIALGGMVVMAFVGWFDLKFIHLSQTVAEINTRKYNPYFQRLEKSLNNRATPISHGKRGSKS